ncbi:MAG: Spi family protease inhibitor [Bacteroidaceae bacterium]|nr:Spi family protease inhibitor [Bacteroidaceae bacterium]
MIYQKLKLAVLFFISLLFSCNQIDDLENNENKSIEDYVFTKQDASTSVSSNEAVEFADSFFVNLNSKKTRMPLSTLKSQNSVKCIKDNGKTLLYIINYQNGGFVIIGATKNYYPILAYSEDGYFDLESIANIPGLCNWLDDVKTNIEDCDNYNDTIKIQMQSLWKKVNPADIVKNYKKRTRANNYSSAQEACWNRCDELFMKYGTEGWNFAPLSDVRQIFEQFGGYYTIAYNQLMYSADFNHSSPETSVFGWKFTPKLEEQIGPILKTQWGQGQGKGNNNYNKYCGGELTGCAPIALAQLVFYNKYPRDFFDWNKLEEENTPQYEYKEKDYTAQFIKKIRDIIGVHNYKGSIYATPGAMEDAIKKIGYHCSKKDPDFIDEERSLSHLCPIIMLGNADNKSWIPITPAKYIGNSHYWVCDGLKRTTTNVLEYYTEWQIDGKGEFTPGWYSLEKPGRNVSLVYGTEHMNWGWNGNHDGWYSDANSPNGNYKHSRKNYYTN